MINPGIEKPLVGKDRTAKRLPRLVFNHLILMVSTPCMVDDVAQTSFQPSMQNELYHKTWKGNDDAVSRTLLINERYVLVSNVIKTI